jgi:serine/threonine protein kinase
VDDDVLLEEEAFSWYDPDNWYPVRIGQVLESRYQVLLKLGFGSVSTAWLCRDLRLVLSSPHLVLCYFLVDRCCREHKYVTIKVYETGHRQSLNEYKILQHLGTIVSSHPGSKLVRLALSSFELPGKNGPHACIVHEPLGLSMAELRERAGGKLPATLLKSMIYGVLLGLSFLHSVAHVVHTGEAHTCLGRCLFGVVC